MPLIDSSRTGFKAEVKTARGCIIQRCDCIHAFQDKVYGKGLRVKNNRPGSNPPKCTVCGKS